jgi:epoxyqueuosine reductase
MSVPAHKPEAQARGPEYKPEAQARGSAANAARLHLTSSLKAAAHRLGFTLVGICPAVAPTGVSRLAEWLDRGYAGQMGYIAARKDAYEHPRHVLAGVRSIVMLGLPYITAAARLPQPGQGRISRYAWGTADYHDIIHDKLKQLIAHVHTLAPQATARGVVDTAPLLEREFAQLAGLGWVGKHTLLINKPAGSYFFLAALLTDLDLACDEPFTTDHCGTCRACLDACPTNAFPEPYVLDASRCISYLTIELRESIPLELRSGIGDWLFGCDVCQDVCPWNHRAPQSDEPTLQPSPDSNPIDLIALFDLDDDAFRLRFRHTPLWRSRRRGILRNAAIILGNQFSAAATQARSASEGPGCKTVHHSAEQLPEVTTALIRGLNDPEPLIRGACAWALGQIATADALKAIGERRKIESDVLVLLELGQRES